MIKKTLLIIGIALHLELKTSRSDQLNDSVETKTYKALENRRINPKKFDLSYRSIKAAYQEEEPRSKAHIVELKKSYKLLLNQLQWSREDIGFALDLYEKILSERFEEKGQSVTPHPKQAILPTLLQHTPVEIPYPKTIVEPQAQQRATRIQPLQPTRNPLNPPLPIKEATHKKWMDFNGYNQPAPYNDFETDYRIHNSTFMRLIEMGLKTPPFASQERLEESIQTLKRTLRDISEPYPGAHERAIKAYRLTAEENMRNQTYYQ